MGVFLTYPKCSAPRESVLDMIKERGLTLQKGLVSQEMHKDGTPHLHAYLKFSKTVETLNCRYFDIKYNGDTFHGKYESAKSAIQTIKYISKYD